jgi:dephospho-CoA kinase
VIQADELGHEVLLPGGEAYADVVREFGPAILDSNGRIDRRALGALVFNQPERLAKLSSIVHPAVGRLQTALVDRIVAQDPEAIIVIEAAILIETGSYKKFDRLIVVDCTPEQQLERAMRRDSLNQEEVLARIARQLPLEEKKRVAHYIINTSGTREDTFEQTRAVYESLRALKPRSTMS